MAENIEDYVTIQAESLHTGSISFGRFELESLSWERRSSFSHNRYLEEVEKYSTPGSVTQKKAYFEAHFKRKALEHETSSGSQNEIDWPTTSNGTEDHVNYIEEYLDRGDGGQSQFAWNVVKTAVSNDQEQDMTDSNEGELQFSWYDETPPAMSDEDEYDLVEDVEGQLQLDQHDETRTVTNEHQQGVLECEFEANNSTSRSPVETIPCNDKKEFDYAIDLVDHDDEHLQGVLECEFEANNSPSQSPVGTIPCNDKKEFDYAIDLMDSDEVLRSHPTCITRLPDKDGPCTAVEQMMKDGPLKEGELLDSYDLTCKKLMVEKDNVPLSNKPQKASLNVKATIESKSIKAKLLNTSRNTQTRRKDSTEESSLSSVKPLTRSLRKMGKETTLRTRSEKHSIRNASPPAVSTLKDSKNKDQENPKARARQETKSGKDNGAKKGSAGPHSITQNGETTLRSSTTRVGKNVHSSKTEINQSSVAFNFKSDARAEKRKEYFTKLEEKFHAKEAEINEIQARNQVENKAEMKQFRRSLNFKATPMPSFYEVLPRDSDGKKTVGTQDLSRKLRSNSSSRSSSVAHQVKSSAVSKVANKQSPSSDRLASSSVECSAAVEGDDSFLVTASIPDLKDETKGISQVSRSWKKVVACKKKKREKPLVHQQQRESKANIEGKVSLERRGVMGKSIAGDRSSSAHVSS